MEFRSHIYVKCFELKNKLSNLILIIAEHRIKHIQLHYLWLL